MRGLVKVDRCLNCRCFIPRGRDFCFVCSEKNREWEKQLEARR